MRPTGRASRPAGSVPRVIDLHTHSTVSDGSEAPERIVEMAHEVGCSAVALTDHDSLAGLAQARMRAEALGLRLVSGCEVSCLPIASGGVHVLVYFVDDPTSPLGLELDRLRDDRRTRNLALVERLDELGIPVTLPMVAAHAGSDEGIGRPHFAQAMVDVGAVGSVDEAFERFLGNGGLAYVPKGRLTVADVCRLARDSGGVPVLAHPTTMGLTGDALAAVVRDMAEAGLGGLEAIYGRYSPQTQDRPRKSGPPVRPGADRWLRFPRCHQTRPPRRDGDGRPEGARPGARSARGGPRRLKPQAGSSRPRHKGTGRPIGCSYGQRT